MSQTSKREDRIFDGDWRTELLLDLLRIDIQNPSIFEFEDIRFVSSVADQFKIMNYITIKQFDVIEKIAKKIEGKV